MSKESATKAPRHVGIVGAGLTGSLTAALLAKLGFQVTVFEKRERTESTAAPQSNTLSSAASDVTSPVHGNATSPTKRSINLALSYRGLSALRAVDVALEEAVLADAIAMPGRVIHSIDHSSKFQPYGQPGEAIYSVGRQALNEHLYRHLLGCPLVTVHFNTAVLGVDHKTGTCIVKEGEQPEATVQFDLVVGADGAYSKVRDYLLQSHRVNFTRTFVKHGYKELNIPPTTVNNEPAFALEPHNGLHIWPRGEFMMVALPNPDKSFTATLFAPHTGLHGFDSLHDAASEEGKEKILSYFREYFPDALAHMPAVVEDFGRNPVGTLVTVRVDPWALGKVLLIGDAAHAVVPFYGQGANAGFQDGFLLYELIQERLEEGLNGLEDIDLSKCARSFAASRQPAAYALADLCLEHYEDMASNTNSNLYLAYKRIEQGIQKLLPGMFTPLYSMVAFSDVPYHLAIQRAQRQEMVIQTAGLAAFTGSVAAVAWLLYKRWLK
eukprot:gene9318-10286_t